MKILQMADNPKFLNVFKLFHEKAIEEKGSFPILEFSSRREKVNKTQNSKLYISL